MSSNLLEKVISTSVIGANGAGGFLPPQQSGQFIDYMWDATVLGSLVRKVAMNSDTVELDRLSIGERLLRVATEAVADPVNPVVAFTKVSLTSTKFRLDWELSSEALEDGLEGNALEDHIARLIAQQTSNDIEDLAINGDTQGHSGDALLKGVDGWRKRLFYGGRVVDADGAELDKALFHRALRAFPRRYLSNRNALKWFTQAGLLQDYMYNALFVETEGQMSIDPRDAAAAQAGGTVPGPNAGWSPTSVFGIRAVEVPLFPEYELDGTAENDGGQGADIWLVDPQNLVWGIRRAVQIFREFVPKKDAIEYTMFTRVGATVENPLASVVVKNVAYADL